MKLGVVILAAGASKRLGKPKQLLQWQGESLLQRIIREVHSVDAPIIQEKKIVVVLGAYAQVITPTLDGYDVLPVYNKEWQSGMASSLRCGMQILSNSGEYDAALLCLCDQPFISAQHINNLVTSFYTSNKGIVASHYKGINGVPAIFAKEYFADLASLDGDQGARLLMKLHADNVVSIECPEAAYDIDTNEEYITALQRKRDEGRE